MQSIEYVKTYSTITDQNYCKRDSDFQKHLDEGEGEFKMVLNKMGYI